MATLDHSKEPWKTSKKAKMPLDRRVNQITGGPYIISIPRHMEKNPHSCVCSFHQLLMPPSATTINPFVNSNLTCCFKYGMIKPENK